MPMLSEEQIFFDNLSCTDQETDPVKNIQEYSSVIKFNHQHLSRLEYHVEDSNNCNIIPHVILIKTNGSNKLTHPLKKMKVSNFQTNFLQKIASYLTYSTQLQVCNRHLSNNSLHFNGPLNLNQVRLLNSVYSSIKMKKIITSPCVPYHHNKGNRSLIPTEISHRTSFPQRYSQCKRLSLSSIQQYSHSYWDFSKTVSLHNTNKRFISSKIVITCMEFDLQGILLAVGDNIGIIRIFDFDEVYCNDMKVRNNRRISYHSNIYNSETENLSNLKYIEPMIQWQTLSQEYRPKISQLKWNPANEDQLIVSFYNHPGIYLYNVEDQSIANILDTKLNISGTTSLSFQYLEENKQLYLLSGNNTGVLFLWSIPRIINVTKIFLKTSNDPIWSLKIWKNNQNITQIIPLSITLKNCVGLIFITGNYGSMSLVDADNLTRNVFETTITPKIICTWNLFNKINDQSVKSNLQTGIKNAVHYRFKRKGKKVIPFHSQIEFILCTNGGWIFSAELKLNRTKNQIKKKSQSYWVSSMVIQCLYKTSKNKFYNSQGKELTNKSKLHYSVPNVPTPSSHFPSAFIVCIADVQPNYLIIPDNDSKVTNESELDFQKLASQGKYEKSLIVYMCDKKMLERWKFSVENNARDLLSQDISGLAVHPNEDWIVLSTLGYPPYLDLQLLQLHS